MNLAPQPLSPVGEFFGMEFEYEGDDSYGGDAELVCGHTTDEDCAICRRNYLCDYDYRHMEDDDECSLSHEDVLDCDYRAPMGHCRYCRHEHDSDCYESDCNCRIPRHSNVTSYTWVEDRGGVGFSVPNDWDVKNDGSLNNGFEITTPRLEATYWTADKLYALLTKVFRNLRNGGARVETTCGCHIHLSLPEWATSYERNKWQRRYMLSAHNQQPLIYSLAIGSLDEHRGEEYCHPIHSACIQLAGNHYGRAQVRTGDRYSGVSLNSNHETTEWRVFNSTLQPDIACSWYLLASHLASYTQFNPPLPPCGSVKQLLRVIGVPKCYDEWFSSYFDLERNQHRMGCSFHVPLYWYSYKSHRARTLSFNRATTVTNQYINNLIATKGVN